MAHSFLTSINKQISCNLAEHNIEPRKDAGSGVWLSLLLPSAVILGGIKYESSLKYQVAACICTGILVQSVIDMFNAYYRKPTPFGAVIFSCTSSTILLYIFTSKGPILSILFGFLSIFSYHKTILPVMKLCPKNFTYGECTTVCQGFILFIFSSAVREVQPQMNCFSVATTMIQLGNLCLMVIATVSYYHNMKEQPGKFYSLIGFVFAFVLLPSLYLSIGENPLVWIYNLFTEDTTAIQLVVFWLFCCILGAAAVMLQINTNQKASTAVRKIFHGLIILVFVPAVIWKPCMIYLASGVVFAIFATLDVCHVVP